MRAPDDELLARFGVMRAMSGLKLASRVMGVSLRTGSRWASDLAKRPDLVEQVRNGVESRMASLEAPIREAIASGLDQLKADVQDGRAPSRTTLRMVILLSNVNARGGGGGTARGHGFALPSMLTTPRPDGSGSAPAAPAIPEAS